MFKTTAIDTLKQDKKCQACCTYCQHGKLGKEADFLYSTVNTYIEDVRKDNRQHLVEIWNEMKRDKEKQRIGWGGALFRDKCHRG